MRTALTLLLVLPVCLCTASDCFDPVQQFALSGAVIKARKNVELEECQKECLQMQHCRSVVYHQREKTCVYHRSDMSSNRENLVRHNGAAYYHRTCYDTVKTRRDAALFSDDCYTTIKGKVLIGIVDQLIQDISSLEDCQEACQKSQQRNDVICKSAAYYAKEKECIIASQSRLDIPDLFIDDPDSIYIENVCLGKGGELKKIQPTKKPVTESATTEQTTQKMTTMKPMTSKPANRMKIASTQLPSTETVVEQSGYDSGLNSNGGEEQIAMAPTTTTTTTTTTTSTTTKSVPVIDPKVIDSYAMEPVKKTATKEVQGYKRRLRDFRTKSCFSVVLPAGLVEDARITRAYSQEQCNDICRLCWRCLKGKPCKATTFDSSREVCALSRERLVGGGVKNADNLVYHNREDC